MKVFVHTFKDGKPTGGLGRNNIKVIFDRMPCLGEHFTLESSGPMYRVTMVLHTPFEKDLGKDLAGEVYAVEVNGTDTIHASFQG